MCRASRKLCQAAQGTMHRANNIAMSSCSAAHALHLHTNTLPCSSLIMCKPLQMVLSTISTAHTVKNAHDLSVILVYMLAAKSNEEIQDSVAFQSYMLQSYVTSCLSGFNLLHLPATLLLCFRRTYQAAFVISPRSNRWPLLCMRQGIEAAFAALNSMLVSLNSTTPTPGEPTGSASDIKGNPSQATTPADTKNAAHQKSDSGSDIKSPSTQAKGSSSDTKASQADWIDFRYVSCLGADMLPDNSVLSSHKASQTSSTSKPPAHSKSPGSRQATANPKCHYDPGCDFTDIEATRESISKLNLAMWSSFGPDAQLHPVPGFKSFPHLACAFDQPDVAYTCVLKSMWVSDMQSQALC